MPSNLVDLDIKIEIQGANDVVVHQRLMDGGQAVLGLAPLLLLQLGDVRQHSCLLAGGATAVGGGAGTAAGGRCGILLDLVLIPGTSVLIAFADFLNLRDVMHELHLGSNATAVVLSDLLATFNPHLEFADMCALFQLRLAYRLGVALAVLNIEKSQLLLLRQPLVDVLLGGEGRLECQARDLQIVKLVLDLLGSLFVASRTGMLKLSEQLLALNTTELEVKCVLTLQFLRELLLSPRILDQLVDIVDLVDQEMSVWQGDLLAGADSLVALPLGLERVRWENFGMKV